MIKSLQGRIGAISATKWFRACELMQVRHRSEIKHYNKKTKPNLTVEYLNGNINLVILSIPACCAENQVPSRCIHSIGKIEVSAVRIYVCQLLSHLTGQQASLQTQHRSLPLTCGAYELCTDATTGHSWLSFSLLSGGRSFVDLKWHELTSYQGWGLCTNYKTSPQQQ